MNGKVAIVTGGASGIGKAIAEGLAAQGASVVIADLHPGGEQVAQSIGGFFVQGDLSQRSACRDLVDKTLERYQRIDILVNDAGFQHVAPIEAFPEDRWDTMIALMLTAPFLLTRYCWPSMKANGWGRIVNIASIHGMVASPFKAAYISAKHGLLGLTRTAALEGGEFGITVNAICPAYVQTPLVDNQIDDQAQANNISRDEVISRIMLAPAAIKRLIQPEEVAQMVVYLCGDLAASITGSALTMDLGWTAR